MNTVADSRLTQTVKVILDLVYGLLVGVTALLVVLTALAPLIQYASGLRLTASVPVAIGEGNEPQFKVQVATPGAQGIEAAFVNEAQGTLRLETTNWRFISLSYGAKLLTAFGLAYTFSLLRSVLQTFLQGETFSAENGTRIRRIGYLVLLVGILRPMFEYLVARSILKQLTIHQPALSLPSPFKAEVILGSLLILILAQIWSYGLELEREQALTV